ncbi:hypothetical protein CsSME_00053376 [Camellia sinensis var. sinensis]
MEGADDSDARMQEMRDDAVALAIKRQNKINNNYVEVYRIASDYYKTYVLKVLCRASTLMRRAWIMKLYNSHSG